MLDVTDSAKEGKPALFFFLWGLQDESVLVMTDMTARWPEP